MAGREVARGGKFGLQVRNDRSDAFSASRRAQFLRVLAATCNVRIAAEAAGVCSSIAYRRRRRDPEFEAQWQAAIVAAYERLETALMARAMGTEDAGAGLDFGDPEAILPAAKIDAELAFKLLGRHRAAAEGRARPLKRSQHVATEEETNKALLKQLAILRRQIENSDGAILLEPKP